MNRKTKGVILVIAALALSLSVMTVCDSDNEAVAVSGDSQTITITSVSYVANAEGWKFFVTVGGNFASSSSGTISVAGQSPVLYLSPGGTYQVGMSTGGPLSGGSYVIVATISGAASIPVTYTVLGSINLTDSAVDAGYTVTIPILFDPVNPTNPAVTWSSSDESIAIVNSSGVVTGVSEGTATITATSEENATIYGTCLVTVYDHVITATAGTGGTISPSGDVHVRNGYSSTFTIAASHGYEVDDVTVDGVSVGVVSTYTFSNVTGDHTISVTFKALPKMTITASAGSNGSITPSGSVSVISGDSQTFTMTASYGYKISNVKVDGVSKGALSTYTFSNVTANHTIVVTFEELPTVTITASAGSNGSITPSGSVSVISGDSQTFTMTASSGYEVSDVIVDGVSKGALSTYTFTDVTADHTISVTFEVLVVTYTITAFAGSNGSITPTGSVTVVSGDSQTFTMTASSGYEVSDVKVDGASVGAVSTYTFSNVTADHTISVTFEEESDSDDGSSLLIIAVIIVIVVVAVIAVVLLRRP